MREQRKHQRIRFNTLPKVRIGQLGLAGSGELENLSLGGLMLRTDLPLKIGEACGCEFVVFESPLIDMSAIVVSKIGDLYGARFQAGPVSEWLIQEAMNDALSSGKASVLSINDLQGHKVMRISGGLNRGLRNDFMHHLTRMGINDLDLAEATEIDEVGFELCRVAVEDYKVRIIHASPNVRAEIKSLLQGRLAS
ncbi:MAG: PilZ domain-containing protein [Propionivibrio sp.]